MTAIRLQGLIRSERPLKQTLPSVHQRSHLPGTKAILSHPSIQQPNH